MISCRLIYVTDTPTGGAARNEIRLTGDSIKIGRGSACQIHLPDHRVSLLHATVMRSVDGKLQIEAAHDALLSINGYLQRTALLGLGSEVGIGPYRLTVESIVEDADITLQVEIPEPLIKPSNEHRAAPLTLASLGISKRRLGFGLAAFILVGLFSLPLLSRFLPAFEAWQARMPLILTDLLNPAPLSAGHGLFAAKCSSCHEQAFHGVADTACAACHKPLNLHLAVEHPQSAALGEQRCIDCHPVHQGKVAAMQNGLPPCLECHQGLTNVKALAEVRDFGEAHPPFRLTVPQGKESIRVRQDAQNLPPEKSGLKFSHQFHLDKEGVSSPDGRNVMTCRDCHKLEESGNHFAPMEMEMTCQQSRCHKIRFVEPINSIVPHGSEREVMNKLRNFYANWLAAAPEEFATACASVATSGHIVKRTLSCADALAGKLAGDTLFGNAGETRECLLCHEIVATEKTDVPWKVLPVRLKHDWQPSAIFPHTRHATLDCLACHDKNNSQASEDIAFPPIEKCRECHAGGAGASGRIKSHCANCHQFHRVAKPPS